jgi:hypothetical protein
MHVADLADPVATAAYLLELGRTVAFDDAAALADDALGFADPPAGAHCVLGHVAEARGDHRGLIDATDAALAVDPDFGPAVEDAAYLAALRRPVLGRATAARRAEHLFCKLDAFSGRVPQLRAQLDLAGSVLGVHLDAPTPRAIDVCDTWQFLGFLAFEGGLVDRFAEQCGWLLPDAERVLLRSWSGVSHAHVRQVSATRRRWRLADVATGAVVDAETLIDERWKPGREGFVLVVPVGRRHAVVGEPIVFDERHRDLARAAVARLALDPMAVAIATLRWRQDLGRAERIGFVFPDVLGDEIDFDDELALLELVRSRRPALARRADAGDASAEADLLVEAIVAHRIITRRTLHTWELAESLLGLGATRDSVLRAVTELTYRELWERAATSEDAA